MNHKRFWGRNMSEALRAVRSALGTDALIMETKNLAQDEGGGVEITAVAEGVAARENFPPPAAPDTSPGRHPIDDLREELAALKSMLGWLAPGLAHKDKIVQLLVKHGVAPEIIARLGEAAQRAGAGDDRERWYRAIAAAIPAGGAIGDGAERVALLGPAGVGKTASLIKLTIFETQRRGGSVGWINMDPRGLAAGDPLAVYSGILGARYEKASHRKDLQRALERLRDCDLVLIDTPGVNPRNNGAIKEIARLFQSAPDVRRLLLLNAATNGADLSEWVASFAQVGLHGLFPTKLDESRYFGALVNTIIAAALPVAYLSLGQNFAGDLEIARPEVFSSLLLSGEGFDA